MTNNLTTFTLTTRQGRPFVEVPWDRAEIIRARLTKRGIPATAYYEPYTRAGIEFHNDMTADAITRLMNESAIAQAV